MIDVYIYVPKDKLQNVIECGIKLSETWQRKIQLGNEVYPCMMGYLNQRDAELADAESELANTVCMRAEVKKRYCYICDGDLYALSKQDNSFVDRYEDSIVSIENYKFGSYRRPECMILCTLLGGELFEVKDDNSVPVLYNSSEELYYDCLETYLVDECGIARKELLNALFKQMERDGSMDSVALPDNLKTDETLYYTNGVRKTFVLGNVDSDEVLACIKADDEKKRVASRLILRSRYE